VSRKAHFRSILCPIDFSEHSKCALRLAVGLAGRHGARLSVVTVTDPLLIEAATTAHYGANFVEQETRKALEAFVAEVMPARTAWAPTPTLLGATGSPATEILASATVHDCDLIVLGTHGTGGYRKMFLGSVTERVLRRATIPVLATPLRTTEAVKFSAKVATFRMPTIVVPIDFGPGTERQVGVAAALAADFGAPLLFVHVVPVLGVLAGLTDVVIAHNQTRLDLMRERLSSIVSTHAAGITSDLDVTVGAPADEIGRLAVERDAGLIVMGLTGHGAITGRPGSVAYRVLATTPVPVLAVPGEEEPGGKRSEQS
jgi:nucleotide-binding universal stress UspA family protein